jgi:3-deoxy-D-manno-octulosonic-acid transferase
VGEVLSAVPLVKGMAARFADRDLAFTATTGQGMKVAEKELGGRVRSMAFMPLDYPLFYARVVGFFRPSVFILVETDLWPGLLFYLRRMRIPAVVVNGRISPRTFRRYHRVRPLGRVLLGAPLKWLVQSEPDRMRLLSIGLPEEMVSVVGNIKFDTDPPPLSESERLELARSLGLEPAGLTWVAGSTHQGEEEVILEVLSRLQGRFPHLKLVLAPRRVERVADVEASASAMGFRTARRSGGEEEKAAARVVVVDTLGELQKIYSLATVAFVGGSLAPVGGHNLLEPGRWGKPVIFGPHIHNFETMAELLIEAGGGRMVRNPAELEQAVSGLLDDGVAAREMGCRAGGFVRSNQGAVDRVLDEIEGLLGP